MSGGGNSQLMKPSRHSDEFVTNIAGWERVSPARGTTPPHGAEPSARSSGLQFCSR
jgi:hypothetical protein